MFHLVDLFTLIIRERDWKERGEVLEGEGGGGNIGRRDNRRESREKDGRRSGRNIISV